MSRHGDWWYFLHFVSVPIVMLIAMFLVPKTSGGGLALEMVLMCVCSGWMMVWTWRWVRAVLIRETQRENDRKANSIGF